MTQWQQNQTDFAGFLSGFFRAYALPANRLVVTIQDKLAIFKRSAQASSCSGQRGFTSKL